MTRPVLLGGRRDLLTTSRAARFFLTWLPVAVCLAVIARESTDSFSSEQTNGPLRHIFEWIFGPVSPARWDDIHFYMRKTGHFIGYGLAGVAWLRAWLLTWLAPLRFCGVWVWRRVGLIMAICCLMVTAATDEIHQTYIPSRTGLISDALIDTAGAAMLMALLILLWLCWPWQAATPVQAKGPLA